MYTTILTYLPLPDAAEAVSLEAARLAEKHGALLIGAHNPIKLTIYGGIPEDIRVQHNERERKTTEEVKAIFEDVASKFGVAHEWRSRLAKDTDAYRDIVAQSHAVDLIVAPAKDFRDPLGHWFDLPERLVMESGRPVLLVPRDRQLATGGEHIAVAWNGSRESARAGFDALPLLRKAASVCVLTVAEDLQKPAPASASDFTAALTRQGVKAELAFVGGTGKPDGEELLAHVAERNCDMLVMGFYGHSRLSQMVWGGVTRHVLKAMTVPVFTSH